MEFLPAQVQESIPQSDLFGVLGATENREGHLGRLGQKHYTRCLDLDLASRQFRINSIRTATVNEPLDANDRFKANPFDELKGIAVAVHDDLGDPIVISQVYEKQVPVIPFAKYPSR
jgi:NAD(P)-dependent dehydrogenase (short-subunit alcohol dehydrogenase family)